MASVARVFPRRGAFCAAREGGVGCGGVRKARVDGPSQVDAGPPASVVSLAARLAAGLTFRVSAVGSIHASGGG
jgi:hypothetical protein